MQHFDVVVIGREIAGLVAGALLAKSGQRVLHLDPPGGRNSYKYKELTFFRRVRLFTSWDGTPAQKRALFELNLISDLNRRLVPLEPSFQVVYPGQRFDVRSDEAALASELEREFPGAGPETLSLLQRVESANLALDKVFDGRALVPPQKWGERRHFKKHLAAHPLPDATSAFAVSAAGAPLVTLAGLPLPFLSSLDPHAESEVRALRAARHLAGGIFTLPGGLDDMADLLAGVIKHHSGVSSSAEIEDVESSWGRIKTLHLKGGETIGCERLLGAEPAERLFARLPPRLHSRSYDKQLARLAPTHRVYTMNIAIKEGGVPEGMGPLGFIVRQPAAPLVEDNLLLWQLSASPGEAGEKKREKDDAARERLREKARSRDGVTRDKDPTKSAAFAASSAAAAERDSEREREVDAPARDRENGLRALTIAVVVPEADARPPAYWPSLRERVLRQVDALMPFSASYREKVDVPWDEGDRQEGRRPVAEMDELYGWDGASTFGITALPYRTPVKNLVLANRQILPGLGIEGEFLAGTAAARLLHTAKDKPSWAEH